MRLFVIEFENYSFVFVGRAVRFSYFEARKTTALMHQVREAISLLFNQVSITYG